VGGFFRLGRAKLALASTEMKKSQTLRSSGWLSYYFSWVQGHP